MWTTGNFTNTLAFYRIIYYNHRSKNKGVFRLSRDQSKDVLFLLLLLRQGF